MKVIWDTDNNRLVKCGGSTRPAPGAAFKSRLYHLVQLQLVDDDGEVLDELVSPTITFGIKLKGQFDDGFLISTTSFTWNADDELYEATLFFGNASLYAALADNADITDDEAFISCNGEFQYILAAAPTVVVCHDGYLDVTIQNKVIRGSEAAAGETPALFQITNDELRVFCPDGVWRRALLSDLS